MAIAPFVVVLCANAREGNTYARRAGLARGRYRVVASASSIRGLRVAHVHELPGFARRPDKHAINAELRWTKGERIKVEMPPALVAPPVDQGDGMGEQLTIDDALLTDAQPDVAAVEARRLFEEVTDPGPQEPDEDEEPDEPSAETEPSEDPAPPAEKPKRKRRRRCGECGDLVLDLDAHECAETPKPAEQPAAPKVVDLGGVIF